MFIVLESQEFAFALRVASQSQVLPEPETVAGWWKMPCTLPAFTQIQMTIPRETGTNSIALIRKSILRASE
jgi:hypothetical protein